MAGEEGNVSEMGKYEKIGQEIGRLVETKQAAYGDSFGKTAAAFALLYPEGIPKEKLGDALTLARIWDKMMRIATNKDALGESPYRDIAGYALLAIERDERPLVAFKAAEAPIKAARCENHFQVHGGDRVRCNYLPGHMGSCCAGDGVGIVRWFP